MSVATDPDQLAEPLRSAVLTLIHDSGGRVYLVSGRRSTSEQVELRKAHCGPTQYDIYDKPSGQCSPPTARPGSSKHESGRAADLGGDLSYVEKRAAELHIAQTVSGERWHFESTLDGGGTSAPVAASQLVSGLTAPLSFGGGIGGLGDAVGVLTDPQTWLRVFYVLAGTGLAALGIMLVSSDARGAALGAVKGAL